MSRKSIKTLASFSMILFSFVILIVLETVLQILGISLHFKPWLPDLPVIFLIKDPNIEGVSKQQNFFIWDRHLFFKGCRFLRAEIVPQEFFLQSQINIQILEEVDNTQDIEILMELVDIPVDFLGQID